MKKTTRKIFALLLVIILILQVNIPSIDSHASDVKVTMAVSSSSISMGKSVTVTVKVSGSSVSAYTLYVSYDAGVLQYTGNSGSAIVNGSGGTLTACGSAAGSFSVTFKAVGNGSSRVSTSGSDIYDINGNTLSVSHAGATIKVATEQSTTQATTQSTTQSNTQSNTQSTTEDKTEVEDPSNDSTETTEEDGLSSNCNLKSLQISPGELDPAFSKGKTSYQVSLDENATSIVVSAVAEDAKAKTSVYGANSLKPGANTVKVTVTAENGAAKVYKLNVICGEILGDAVCTINNEEYSFITDDSIPEIPEGFTNTTAKYKDWEVVAYTTANKKITIVPLADSDGNTYWYVYDEKTDEFTPYVEYSAAYVRYIILKLPESVTLPEGYKEANLDMGNGFVTAYNNSSISNDIYLVYAMNINGEASLYYYDKVEKSFMRYVAGDIEEEAATPADSDEIATASEPEKVEPDDDKNNNLYKYIAIIGAILFAIMLIVIIILGIKNKNLKEKLGLYEDIDETPDEDDIKFGETSKKAVTSDVEALKEEIKEESTVNYVCGDASNDAADDNANDIATNDAADDNANDITTKDAADDTIEEDGDDIILEDADEAASDFVAEYKEEINNPVLDAMKNRPYGIDSAFEVVEKAEEAADADGINETAENIVETGSKIEFPNKTMEDDDEEE